jgi:hypothetical protein
LRCFRDTTDARVVQEVRTGTGRIINRASDVALARAGF